MYTAITEELANDPWIKVVGMLQQNWAVVVEQDQSTLVVFHNDLCAVFDEISVPSTSEAEAAKMNIPREGEAGPYEPQMINASILG